MTAIEQRLARVRAFLADASLDALVVTHLPNVRYLCGFSGTAGALVLTPSRCILAVDFRYITAARSLEAAGGDRPAIDIAPVERSHDVTIVELLEQLRAPRIGIEAASMPVARFNKLSAALAGGTAVPVDVDVPCPVLAATERMVERARVIKDTVEIGRLREAARRLSAVGRRLPSIVRPGRTEREVAGSIDAELRAVGFERPAFDTIVASGPNSALPHARPTDRRLGPADGVVLDFGGVYDGYCVDLTRTVQLGGATGELRRIFEAVVAAQTAAIRRVAPGVRASEIDAAAREVLERAGLGQAFGHGTGHGLGLEVHEEPRVGKLVPGVPDEAMAPGMVFTIEPGAYIPGMGGVRIEDDVLVIEDGCEMLTDVPIQLI